MTLTDNDHILLAEYFPDLQYDPVARRITGELNFCAGYDRNTGKLCIEQQGRDADCRRLPGFICDVFEVEIRLDDESIGPNGWPQVVEVGGRYQSIAERCGVSPADLHFFSKGICCLGIRLSRERNLTLERFLHELVIPFLYRLAYTDHFGIDASRNDLWGELPHGDDGYAQYYQTMREYARLNTGRNAPCPCGSERKYKRCCLDEVAAALLRHPPDAD